MPQKALIKNGTENIMEETRIIYEDSYIDEIVEVPVEIIKY